MGRALAVKSNVRKNIVADGIANLLCHLYGTFVAVIVQTFVSCFGHLSNSLQRHTHPVLLQGTMSPADSLGVSLIIEAEIADFIKCILGEFNCTTIFIYVISLLTE